MTARVLGATGGMLLVLTVAAAPATAADVPLGAHVSDCARADLGQRPSPPTVVCTCMHDGQTHTFASFGAMVAHMRDMHP